MRRILAAALKIAVSAALLYFSLRTVDFAALGARLSAHSLGWLGLGIACSLFQTWLAAVRWHMLSAACDAPLPTPQAFRYNMIGTFFNQTLPSSIGGDAVRLWLLGRRYGWRAATYSIFVDRAIGLIALAILILVCLPWSLHTIVDPQARAALVVVEAAALAAGIGFLSLALVPNSWLARFQPLHHLRRCALIAGRALFGGLSGVGLTGMSLAIHVGTAAVAWCAARAIAAPVAFTDLLMLLPPVVLITLVPVSIAGWGVREAALGAAFLAAGLPGPEGVKVSLIYGAIGFLIGGLGGLVWIASPEKAEKGDRQMDVPATVP
jgi:uncharacterized membrane protein YbhN (UPF0104 family)